MMKSNSIEFAPLRSLDDFILESARFQMPNFNDFEKWGNRVTNNLLYYQSNYMLASIIIIIVFTVLHPIQMVMGSILLSIIFCMFCFITNESGVLGQFKQNHPVISTAVLFSVGYYLFGMMIGSLLIFLLGILVPFTGIFIHASLRLRNIKNKLTNKVETLGLKQTPMGVFLDVMGLERLNHLLKGKNQFHSQNIYVK